MATTSQRLLLIEPPFYRLFKDTYSLTRLPLSLGYLAGAAAAAGCEVMVYNADFVPRAEPKSIRHLSGAGFENYLRQLGDLSAGVWQTIQKTVADFAPTVVGITAKSQNYASACNVAELARQAAPGALVVLGGPHASMVPMDVLKCPWVDVSVYGEGEATMVELLAARRDGRGFDGIRGIAYRSGGQAVQTPPRPFLADLDSLAFPHQIAPAMLKDYAQYPPEAFRYIISSRGCPYQCFFCGSRMIWGRKVRHRSPDNVVREIQGLQKLGLAAVNFEDDMLGVTPEHTHRLCQALRTLRPAVRWGCEMHVNSVTDAVIADMKSAGCYAISIGIESGNNDILRHMRKTFTIDKAMEACRIVKRHGLHLSALFMVGFCQETEETLADTREAIRACKCDNVVYSIFTPYPGTEAFDFCKQHGLIGDDFNPALFNHQSPANCFCTGIKPERFRVLAREIEEIVERKNRRSSLRRFLPTTLLGKIARHGLGDSLRQAWRMLRW